MTESFTNAAQVADRAIDTTRESAILCLPDPNYPGVSGDAGQKYYARKSHTFHASITHPRKGRLVAKDVTRDSARQTTPQDDSCLGEAEIVSHNSAMTKTPAKADQHVTQEVPLTTRAKAPVNASTPRDVTLCIEGEAGLSTRKRAKMRTPAFDAAELAGLVKTRRVWQTARARLHLQGLALCRSACGGDKVEAGKLYKATIMGDDTSLLALLGPFLEDIERWDNRVAPVEKAIVKSMGASPYMPYIEATKGLGAISVATIVGLIPPLTYDTLPKYWRALGLGVTDGKKDPLIVPGVVDRRWKRAAAYVLACGVMKASDPVLRPIYDREKAKALAKEWTKARAHNHALRYVSKCIVRRLWRAAWAANQTSP